MTTMFSNDQQLREEDAELFFYSDVTWTRKHVRAAADLVRDFQGHGYFQTSTDSLIDASATATVTLEFEAIGGVLTVPAGTLVTVEDRSQAGYSNGVVGYVTDDELIVADGMTGTVTATASAEGAYKDELTWPVASGVAIDRDGDGVGEKALKHR